MMTFKKHYEYSISEILEKLSLAVQKTIPYIEDCRDSGIYGGENINKDLSYVIGCLQICNDRIASIKLDSFRQYIRDDEATYNWDKKLSKEKK